MSLTEKFQQFVGQSVKPPGRATCDICDTTSALSNLAFEENMMLSFTIAGQPANDLDDMFDDKKMVVNLEENDQGILVVDSMHVA